MIVGFAPSNQYCEQMKKIIFKISFPHKLHATYMNLNKLYIKLFIYVEPITNKRHVGQILLLKA